jgi:hypothetical protein
MKWYTNITLEQPKDPTDVLDYVMDFTPLLQTDTISTHTVTVTNVTLDSSSVTNNVVTMYLSGGTAGTTAKVTVKIVTTNSRTYERSFKIKIEDQ